MRPILHLVAPLLLKIRWSRTVVSFPLFTLVPMVVTPQPHRLSSFDDSGFRAAPQLGRRDRPPSGTRCATSHSSNSNALAISCGKRRPIFHA